MHLPCKLTISSFLWPRYLPEVISKIGTSSQHEMDDNKEDYEQDQVIIHSIWLDLTFLDGVFNLVERGDVNGTPIGEWPKINTLLNNFVEFVAKRCCITTPDIHKVTGVLVQHSKLPKVQEQSLQPGIPCCGLKFFGEWIFTLHSSNCFGHFVIFHKIDEKTVENVEFLFGLWTTCEQDKTCHGVTWVLRIGVNIYKPL